MKTTIVVSGLLGSLLLPQATWACGLDGIPSLSVNGRLVTKNPSYTSSSDVVDTWTPFLSSGRLVAGENLRFAEDPRQVARSLPTAGFRFPWRWSFGDGTTTRGMSVRHRYRRPGSYILTTEAYVIAGSQKEWVAFERATVTIQS